ncbi:hypothetical protein [uncultured Draconibacterium sp.]|uniref:hypothetical protein n=1 Tax=uncultured Draconibacterium sp. TaxID=1573823 RepID=UPI0025DCAC24|nr:hypothetical protein [uncultured Draconibacterium sp.]
MRNLTLLMVTSVYVFLLLGSCSQDEEVNIIFDDELQTVAYGVKKLQQHFEDIQLLSYANVDSSPNMTKVSIILNDGSLVEGKYLKKCNEITTNDGYAILKEGRNILVIGKTQRGCLYGLMDILEQTNDRKSLKKIIEKTENSTISFRAIKYNLPWAPYRKGLHSDVHLETCRDLAYWESFLDMMVKNRFNALTLWSKHIFPFMIKAKNYPLATPYSNEEMAEWKYFWASLFKMAKVRGIETYMLNWNIIVSSQFAEAYGAKEYSDRSELVEKYTRESVTQMINEYQDLTGFGVTLADWMGNSGKERMTPQEREKWIEKTIIQGMKDAERETKFIHRAVLVGEPDEMRQVIDKAGFNHKTVVEIKFNWSHGHSTPLMALTHANDNGQIMEGLWNPKPDNFFIAWTIRNEDIFVLRWGEPDFIRKHIKMNNHDYVDGYFIGSEGYIPAKDYSHFDNEIKTWKFAFQKQWMFYHTWGRLLYNPNITDEDLAKQLVKRYTETDGISLLQAYSLASKVPLYIASFFKATWDLTLYSEGFLTPYSTTYKNKNSPFISIDELIQSEPLSSKEYLSIKKYCQLINSAAQIPEGVITPTQLSEKIFMECEEALQIIEKLRKHSVNETLNSELDDLETWCYLGFYFADKLNAGVALEKFNLNKTHLHKENAIRYLGKCVDYWAKVIDLTVDRYKPMPYVSHAHDMTKWPGFEQFHWSFFMKDVEKDIEYAKSLN